MTLPGEERPVGTLHPTTQIRRLVEDAFLGLGYEIVDDREVETAHYNFDQLAFPPAHPTRSPRDTFFIDPERLLRTETSPSQIHVMEAKKPPIYMVSIGRVYRRDEIEPTRFPIFHQFEGLAVDRGITLADLKGTLLHVMRFLFGDDRRSASARTISRSRSLRSSRTSPARTATSGLPHVQVHRLDRARRRRDGRPPGAGERRHRPEEWSGFAFGCGLERAAQLRYDITEIRPFWENDLRVLRQF